MGILLEGVVCVAVFFAIGATVRLLITIGWQLIAAREWRSRGLASTEVVVITGALCGLMWAGLLGLVALAGWLVAHFVPAAWAWLLGSWGARAGVVGGLLWQALPWLGESGRELGERMRATYFENHRDELPARLTPRQDAYVRHCRQLAERLATAEAGAAPADGDEGQALLPFRVESAAQGQAVSDQPPGFGPGGDWTVLSCRLEHAGRSARFYLAERSGAPSSDLPFAWGEGRLWTDDRADGETLLAAFRQAFRTDETVEAEAPVTPGLLACPTVVLGRGVGRGKESFSGKGTWTATKWTLNEVDEVFVNWSVAEKRGELAEKDDVYRAGLQAALTALAAAGSGRSRPE